MAWDNELIHNKSGLRFAVSSGLHRTPDSIFAGFFLKDPPTIEAILKRDPVVFDILESILKQHEGLEALYYLYWLKDDEYIEQLLSDQDRLGEAVARCQAAYSSPLCDDNDRLVIAYFMDAVADPREFASRLLAKRRKRKQAKKSTKQTGIVYLLKSGPFYKIGVSKTLDKRIEQLATLPPFDIELLHTIPSNDMYGLEKELHEHFADKRKNGEWFELTDNDVEYVKGL